MNDQAAVETIENILKSSGPITSVEISDMTDINKLKIASRLNKMRTLGMVEKIDQGAGKAALWVWSNPIVNEKSESLPDCHCTSSCDHKIPSMLKEKGYCSREGGQCTTADPSKEQEDEQAQEPTQQAHSDITTADYIASECDAIKAMLLSKNAQYGDSALNPMRIFSKCDATEQIRVRIDDKISRLIRGQSGQEDAKLDLIGYLILERIAEKWHGGKK